ncbi:MAG TPA: dihydrofolate reductase family protein [Cyclobacteriaceae bacterium]|nr:dihydrofolate reductase family protein [Cyclobacteriaceae bacterium]
MRKLILSMQISIDGFIEGENGDMSWMALDEPMSWDDTFEMLSTVDTALLGGVTFPIYRDHWKGCLAGSKCSANELKYAKWADKTQHLVVSKTLKDPEWQNTKVISGSVVEEVKKLKEQKGGDIYLVGGGMLARTMIDAGLVDAYRLTVSPYIAKKGKSLWSPLTNTHKLEPAGVKQLELGAIVLRYNEKK